MQSTISRAWRDDVENWKALTKMARWSMGCYTAIVCPMLVGRRRNRRPESRGRTDQSRSIGNCQQIVSGDVGCWLCKLQYFWFSLPTSPIFDMWFFPSANKKIEIDFWFWSRTTTTISKENSVLYCACTDITELTIAANKQGWKFKWMGLDLKPGLRCK